MMESSANKRYEEIIMNTQTATEFGGACSARAIAAQDCARNVKNAREAGEWVHAHYYDLALGAMAEVGLPSWAMIARKNFLAGEMGVTGTARAAKVARDEFEPLDNGGAS